MSIPTTSLTAKLIYGAAAIALLSACGSSDLNSEAFNRDDISTSGAVTEIEGGVSVDGTVTVAAGDDLDLILENANIDIIYDKVGDLINFDGEAELPVQLTDTLSLEPGVKAKVGLKTGAEINADPDFGILLLDDRDYFIFYLSGETDIRIQNRNAPDEFQDITLSSPLGAKTFIIVDPRDQMHYRFSSTPLVGTYGSGESSSGFLPFAPGLEFSELDSFTGHRLDNGALGIGFKVFDFFEIEGTRVIKDPQFSDIDWDDPFASTIEAKAGLNGGLDFSFGVLGVGFFSFDLVETSGTVDLGFDRQQAAFDLLVQPDTSWVPDWFHFVPQTEARGQLFINGDIDFGLNLTSAFKSKFPEADVQGTMEVTKDSTTLVGTTTNAGKTLQASITFENSITTGRVSFPEEFVDDVKGQVGAEIDAMLAGAEEKIAALEQAKTDYEFEASLRGLRPTLSPLADAVTARLEALPGQVEAQARQSTTDAINTTCHKTDLGLTVVTTCVKDVLPKRTQDSIINSAGRNARRETEAGIEDALEAMADLKAASQQTDSDETRKALKSAITVAYDNRTVSRTVRIDHDFGVPFGTREIYKTDIKRDVMTPAQIQALLDARSYIDFIPEKSNAVISAQAIIDAIPADEFLQAAKAQVDQSMDNIPSIGGVGYVSEGTAYKGFLTIGGKDYEVDFNVLDPVALQKGLAERLALHMAEDLK